MSTATETLHIRRFISSKHQTLGIMTVLLGSTLLYTCQTLELPWLENQFQKSCIPTGTYTVVKRHSPKYGNHFHITNVKDRSYILIHVGNYHTDIKGCIAVGRTHTDINGDGCKDVTDSKNTIKMLNSLLPDEFNLTIS